MCFGFCRHGALPVLDRGVKVENIVHFVMDQDVEGKEMDPNV